METLDLSRVAGVDLSQHLGDERSVRPQFDDLREWDTELGEPPDTQKAGEMVGAVLLVSVRPALRLLEQADPVVVPAGQRFGSACPLEAVRPPSTGICAPLT